MSGPPGSAWLGALGAMVLAAVLGGSLVFSAYPAAGAGVQHGAHSPRVPAASRAHSGQPGPSAGTATPTGNVGQQPGPDPSDSASARPGHQPSTGPSVSPEPTSAPPSSAVPTPTPSAGPSRSAAPSRHATRPRHQVAPREQLVEPYVAPEFIGPGAAVPTPTPGPLDFAPDPRVPVPTSAPSPIPTPTTADNQAAALTQPRSLIWSGVFALAMAAVGLLMIGRRRRQW